MKPLVILVSLMLLPLCLQAQPRVNPPQAFEFNEEGGIMKYICPPDSKSKDCEDIPFIDNKRRPPLECNCDPLKPEIKRITIKNRKNRMSVIELQVVDPQTKTIRSYVSANSFPTKEARVLVVAWQNNAPKAISVARNQTKTPVPELH